MTHRYGHSSGTERATRKRAEASETGESTPEGPTIRNTADLLRETLLDQRIVEFHNPVFVGSARFAGFVITEFNPDHDDPDGTLAARLNASLARLLRG